MVGWHHRLSGHEFEQTLGDSEGQGSLVCCSPWSCKESILKEFSLEYSLEGLILKLKFQYFGHLMQRTDSFEKTLTLEKIGRGQQRMRWLDGITDSVDMNLSKI